MIKGMFSLVGFFYLNFSSPSSVAFNLQITQVKLHVSLNFVHAKTEANILIIFQTNWQVL